MSLAGWILLLLIVAAAGYYLFRQQRRVVRPGASRPALPSTPTGNDDLSTLGLSEVRVAGNRESSRETRPADEPRGASRATSRAESPDRSGREMGDRLGVSEARPVTRPSESRPVESRSEARPTEARPVASARPASPARVRPGTDLWDEDDRTVPHLLASLAAHVGGTAAVLRHRDGAYHVEALAGGPALPDPIDVDDCPLHRAPQDRVLTVLPDDLGGLSALGDAPRAYARALADPPAARAFLVVTTPDEDEDPEALAQIERYADLLASLTDLRATDLDTEVEEPTRDAPVPRATIIQEEQEKARDADRPLAFALVTLAHAEELLEAGGPDLSKADAALHTRLTEAPHVRRVEPFGDLLVGAFLDLAPDAMAAWCTELAASDPPLFIGAVAPAEGEPEAVRDAAAEALRDAYDQRRAQIVSA